MKSFIVFAAALCAVVTVGYAETLAQLYTRLNQCAKEHKLSKECYRSWCENKLLPVPGPELDALEHFNRCMWQSSGTVTSKAGGGFVADAEAAAKLVEPENAGKMKDIVHNFDPKDAKSIEGIDGAAWQFYIHFADSDPHLFTNFCNKFEETVTWEWL